MFDEYGSKMGKILRSGLSDRCLWCINEENYFQVGCPFFFFSFLAFRVRKTDIRTLTTAAKHFCGLTANRKFNNHLVG